MAKYLFIFCTCLAMHCVGTTNTLSTIKGKGIITKINLKIVSSLGEKYFTITDPKLLDSINIAFQKASEIDVPTGGIFEIWVDISVLKNGMKANFIIQFNKYNGWMIVIENRAFKSDYVFHLIERYK